MLLNNTHQPAALPQRIVSLVPSQTELLYDLGLEARVCGITRYCIHPAHWQKTKAIVGGTKKIKFHTLHALHPDLIIANHEENVREQVEKLADDYPVWVTDVGDLPGALDMIRDIGQLTGTPGPAEMIRRNVETAFAGLSRPRHRFRTGYLIWKDPYMTVGRDTFIHDLLSRIGLENIFSDRIRYPEINLSEILERHCELLLLSSEPYPFGPTHLEELQRDLPNTRIRLVDGELFSWYGSRLQQSPGYFQKMLEEPA
jgi:ABC-type Fe3+-hydroxamate transport system substrate-binding protein